MDRVRFDTGADGLRNCGAMAGGRLSEVSDDANNDKELNLEIEWWP